MTSLLSLGLFHGTSHPSLLGTRPHILFLSHTLSYSLLSLNLLTEFPRSDSFCLVVLFLESLFRCFSDCLIRLLYSFLSVMYLKYAAAALTAVLPLCNAQTYSKCNPTKSMFDTL